MSKASEGKVDYATRLSSDFKIKDCPAFIAATGKQTKGPKVLVFNDADIPLTIEGFKERKQINVGLVVVDCLADGYTRVPYECNNNGVYKLGTNPLPLSVKSAWPEDPDGTLSMLTCWPYGILEGCPKDKDDRNEEFKWEVHPGMVLRTMFWADSARGGKPSDKGKGIQCPAECDVIKAFTLLEIELVCKGWSKWEPGDVNPEAKNKPRDICPVKKGYGMSVVSMNPLTGASLYSVTEKLAKTMATTLDDSRAKQQAWQARFHSIENLIQTQSVPFLVRSVSVDARIDLDERPELSAEPLQLTISNWASSPGADGGNSIDVLHEDAMRATNTTDIASACALLELAANAGALSVVVCANQYRPGKEHIKSMYYGFPLVDTRVLLQSIAVPVDPDSLTVDETENYFVFETGFKVAFPASSAAGSGNEGGGDEDDDNNDAENNSGEENHQRPAASKTNGVEGKEDHGDGEEGGEEQMLSPHLYISKDPFTSVKGATPLPTPDFMMVGSNIQLQKAYYARFVHPVHPHRCVLWGGYINMSKPQIMMPGAMGAAASAAAAASKKRARWAGNASLFQDPFGCAASDGKTSAAVRSSAPAAAVAKASLVDAAPASSSSSSSSSKKKEGGSDYVAATPAKKKAKAATQS